MNRQSISWQCALGSAALLIVGCSDPQSMVPLSPTAPLSARQTGSSSAVKPGEPGAASERMLFKIKLSPEGDSRAEGVMLFEIVGGYFTARVHAAGLEPLQRIPQHIHLNPTCNPGGGILINLDENLTVAGEGPGVGTAYPLANEGGVVNYQASRPLSELLTAVNTFFGAGLGTVEDLLAWLDLENRNGHMHVAFGPPFPAVNCGEIERIN
jgi:hypothetical protein